MTPRSPAPLSAKQHRFVAEYLLDLNAAAAARRAGYSEKTAKQQGARLLATPSVAGAIEEAQSALAADLGVRQEQVVATLAAIAFTEIRDVVTWGDDYEDDGRRCMSVQLRPAASLSADAAAAVNEFHVDAQGRLRVKLHDKLRALELLGKHLGMFKESVEHRLPGPIEVKLSFTLNPDQE